MTTIIDVITSFHTTYFTPQQSLPIKTCQDLAKRSDSRVSPWQVCRLHNGRQEHQTLVTQSMSLNYG